MIYEKNIETIYKEIRSILSSEESLVDVYLTGSYSTGELREDYLDTPSDIDIIIVYQDKQELNKIKPKLDMYVNDNPNFSFCFCFYKNFINSALSNYCLSIDFENPILKKLPLKYLDLREKTLDNKRWVYLLQTALYYFAKFMLTENLIYLSKVYFNLIRMLIYKKRLVLKNEYINVFEIEKRINELKIDRELYNDNISFYYKKKSLSGNALDNTIFFIYQQLIELIRSSDIYTEISFLTSTNYYFLLAKEKGIFRINNVEYKKLINYIMFENTGNGNESCISL
ncbi:MAG: nucleotidyltransferase domain-containing protein [Clostridia bacterium]|nr:nucleotidyltransferase domain-containing protein [Clostridia bacterium]